MHDDDHSEPSGWRWIGTSVLVVVSALYLFGAAVNLANIASANGFDWLEAPLKWQILDVVYLFLNLLTAIGLWNIAQVPITAFYVNAFSQLVLYTAGARWLMDVPPPFTPDAAQMAQIDLLVAFHTVAIVLVTATVLALGRAQPRSQSR